MTTVLITRPFAQAKSLAEKLTRLNIKPVIFPAIEIKPIEFEKRDLTQFNMIIFVSPAAVIHFSHSIKKLPHRIKIFTVGKSTAKMIEALGWPKAIYPTPHFNQASLLKLEELQHIAQQDVLIIQGRNGSTELKATLESRDALVSELIVYERILPTPKNLPDLDAVDIIISTSQEGLRNLVTLCGPMIKTKKLLLSSQKLIDLAKILGFTQEIFLAQNAGDEALIQALPTQA